jgi:glutathione peroxidase
MFQTLSKTTWLVFLVIGLIANSAEAQTAASKSDKSKAGSKEVASTEIPTALSFSMKSIDGAEVALSKYKGNVVMFVNVASKCGRTPQYEQLQLLHEKYSEQGLSIVGVPCNQFGGQEPGTETEIAEFCQKNYGVEFDMLAKVDVKDKTKCELYKHLTSLSLAPVGNGDIKWNFEKIVLNRKGEPIARFGSKVKPDNSDVVAAIETALAEKATTHYSHVSEKLGRTYYLFKKEVPLKNSDKIQTIYFFAKDPNNKKGTPLDSVPADRQVSETKTGMLVLKKKK